MLSSLGLLMELELSNEKYIFLVKSNMDSADHKPPVLQHLITNFKHLQGMRYRINVSLHFKIMLMTRYHSVTILQAIHWEILFSWACLVLLME